MEFLNTLTAPRQDTWASWPGQAATDVTTEGGARSSRKLSLRTNFSYPRLSRHESRESHSSAGSVPGMTDTSDCDLSCDDDGIYNTSAGELWDSFWPADTAPSVCQPSQEHQPTLAQSVQPCEYFGVKPAGCHKPSYEDDIPFRDHYMKVAEATSTHPIYRSPSERDLPKISAMIYPRAPANSTPRRPHPPRTSSLSFKRPLVPQRPLFQNEGGSRAGLRSSKSIQNIPPPLSITLPSTLNSNMPLTRQRSSTTTKTATSVPVSPAYPPPPPPQALRSSTSAINIRDKSWAQGDSNNNNNKVSTPRVTIAPPPALLPSALPKQPTAAPAATRPELSRVVSVFELDSDSEDEGNSFTRRIARGLHKKSASEKRERKAVTPGSRDRDAARERRRNSRGLDRRRGGSLGRIFWLMGR